MPVFIDGYDKAAIIDMRSYPARSVTEPSKEKSLRGAKDGFTETLMTNVALIRRRIRDPKLTMSYLNIGKIYIIDRRDPYTAYFIGKSNRFLY